MAKGPKPTKAERDASDAHSPANAEWSHDRSAAAGCSPGEAWSSSARPADWEAGWDYTESQLELSPRFAESLGKQPTFEYGAAV